MARTKKASNDQQNPKAVKQQHQLSTVAESTNYEVISTIPMTTCGKTVAIETSPGTNNVNAKSDNHKNHHSRSSTIKKNESNDSAKNEAVSVNDTSAITDDLEISGIDSLMTDDSRASSVIDLTESINETKEKIEFSNKNDKQGSGTAENDKQQQGSTAACRKSIRKSVKRLTCTTTPRYDIAKERTSKGTPYIRKVSVVSSANNRNNLLNKMKLSTGKKERIADEVKKSVNVKRVTFNNSPSMNKASSSSTAVKLTSKKQSTVKMPNFNDIHRKLFEKMESIDVTVRKREERIKAASSKKANQGSSQGNDENTTTKSKKVVRKLDNWQPGPSKILHTDNSEAVKELPKSVRPKSTVGVLQERSNCDTVFKFTGSSDSKIETQSLQREKTVENRSTRSQRQQAYKARSVAKIHPSQNSDRLKGVRLNRRFQLQMQYRENEL